MVGTCEPSVDTERVSSGPDSGQPATGVVTRYIHCAPSMGALRLGRKGVRVAATMFATTCGSLQHWLQRWTFRSVAKLTGGVGGNRCNTPPGEHATISTHARQGDLRW